MLKINIWPNYLGADFILGISFFEAFKLTKNSDPDKYSYSGCGIGFNERSAFSLSSCDGFGKNVIIF